MNSSVRKLDKWSFNVSPYEDIRMELKQRVDRSVVAPLPGMADHGRQDRDKLRRSLKEGIWDLICRVFEVYPEVELEIGASRICIYGKSIAATDAYAIAEIFGAPPSDCSHC